MTNGRYKQAQSHIHIKRLRMRGERRTRETEKNPFTRRRKKGPCWLSPPLQIHPSCACCKSKNENKNANLCTSCSVKIATPNSKPHQDTQGVSRGRACCTYRGKSRMDLATRRLVPLGRCSQPFRRDPRHPLQNPRYEEAPAKGAFACRPTSHPCHPLLLTTLTRKLHQQKPLCLI